MNSLHSTKIGLRHVIRKIKIYDGQIFGLIVNKFMIQFNGWYNFFLNAGDTITCPENAQCIEGPVTATCECLSGFAPVQNGAGMRCERKKL